MSAQLDRELRDALEELVGGRPPTGLAAAAIHQARRRRRSILAGSAGVIVLVIVALVAVPLVRHPAALGDSSVPGNATPAFGPRAIVAYSGVHRLGAMAGDEVSLLLNPTTGGYEEFPFRLVVPSPDGRRAFVVDGDGSAENPRRGGLLDRASRVVTWLPVGSANPDGADWSPDGRQILLTDRQRNGFTVVDVATLSQSFVLLPPAASANTLQLGLFLSWEPDGQGVFLLLSSPSSLDGLVANGGIAHFGLDGTLRDITTITEAPYLGRALVSPSGSTILLIVGPVGHVVDTATGHDVIVDLTFAPVAWVDESHLLASAPDLGQLSVVDLHGTVSASLPWPPGVGAFRDVYVGSSTGLPSSSVALTF